MLYKFIIKNIVQIFYSTNDVKYLDEDKLDNIRENINKKNNLNGSLGWGYYF
tara:strand:- start:389 stop:544 length:156 start_codon:yes stop_codon:yes gene_type:complete